MKQILLTLAIVAGVGIVDAADSPQEHGELVFPLRAEDNHAPAIVECPNGDFIASWYRRSGKRSSDGVAIYGRRSASGKAVGAKNSGWSTHPGFQMATRA